MQGKSLLYEYCSAALLLCCSAALLHDMCFVEVQYSYRDSTDLICSIRLDLLDLETFLVALLWCLEDAVTLELVEVVLPCMTGKRPFFSTRAESRI